MEGVERVTEKTLMQNNGGAGVYVCDYRKYYDLENPDWKFDTIPEFMDGKNVMDFFDADIEERLNALDEEEAELERNNAYALPEDSDEEEIDEEDMLIYEAIKDKQKTARSESHTTKSLTTIAIRNRGKTEEAIKEQLEAVGLESAGVIEHTRGRKRARSVEPIPSTAQEIAEMSTSQKRAVSNSRARSTAAELKRARSQSTGRDISSSRAPVSATTGPKEHSLAPHQKKQALKGKKVLERHLFKHAKGGPGDREYYEMKPKHMNSGKRSLGTSTIGR